MRSAKYEKALFLIGDGDNGKGTILKLLEAFLGIINTSHASLKELSDDKFAASNLNHKLANICADIEHGQINETSFFKRLVSGDSIRAQEKHQPAFDFANYAKLIFSSNYFPKSKDDSYAWLKRIIPIFCPNTFDENKDVFLLEKLTTEEELSGLLNLALVGLSQLIKDGTFNHVENINSLSNYYLHSKDSIAKFIQEKCVLNDNTFIVSQSLFDAYSSFCMAAQVKAVDYGSFGAYLKKIDIEKWRTMKSGVRMYSYKGIGLKGQ